MKVIAKYKFTIDNVVRSFIEEQIEYYNENKRYIEEVKAEAIPSTVPKYGPQTGGFNPEQRPTEDIVIRRNPQYLIETERIVKVIGSVLEKLSETDMELIRLKYWTAGLTPEGIALKLNLGRTTVYERLNNILVEIGRRLGYINL